MPKPKPFQRPGIEISSGPRRVWRDVPIEDTAIGDTVAEFGVLDFKEMGATTVLILSSLNRSERLDKGTMVRAFVMPSQEPQ